MRQSAKQVGGIYHMRIVHQQVGVWHLLLAILL